MDEKILTRAMRKAVELGVFPKYADEETYLRNWAAMEKILKAASSVEQKGESAKKIASKNGSR